MNSLLLYRRQFIISSQKPDYFREWNQVHLNHGFTLSVHPDLELTESNNGKINLILLGYLLDPFSPEKNNQNILDELAVNIEDFQGLINKTEKYSGRWVIVYQDNSRINLLHDPFGQRSVYYFFKDDEIACASDPSLIKRFFPLQRDESVELKEFMASENYRKTENSWIGDDTVYLNVKHLMPNFYLDIFKGKAIRYWPMIPLGKLELNKGAMMGAEILNGSMIAASNRKKLALAVTAGWDSRLMLAASKSVKDRVKYFISIPDEEFKEKNDYFIPDRLFKQLGLPFYIQNCADPISDEFKEIYKTNVTGARCNLTKAKFIYHYLKEFQNVWLVNGNATELFRVPPHHRPLLNRKMTFADLSGGFLSYPGVPYVESHLESWLKEVKEHCMQNHINLQSHIGLFDLLYWEERLGNWAAMYPAEQDIAAEQFSPSNNRLLVRLMVSVDIKYRIFPDYLLFRKMIEIMWPEILREPINPKKIRPLLRVWGRHLLLKYSNGY